MEIRGSMRADETFREYNGLRKCSGKAPWAIRGHMVQCGAAVERA